MGEKRKRGAADDLLKAIEQGGNIPISSDEDSASESESESPKKKVDEEKIEEGSISRLSNKSIVTRQRTLASTSTNQLEFSNMGISNSLISALNAMSIKLPTEIQMACIPPLLAGRDCIGNAKTGSGKTIAFALPILQALSRDPYGIFALILTPTRELAFQISDQFGVLGLPLNVRTATIVGGMDMIAQAIELKNKPHIVIATPGRLVDHLNSSGSEIDLSRVKFLVLDEADRLLTDTFAPELQRLFSLIPKDRQTALFTATMTPAVEQLANTPPRAGKLNPFIHRMAEKIETVSTLRQYYILAPPQMRELYLYRLLTHPPEIILHLRRAPPQPVSRNKKSRARTTTDATPEKLQPPPTIIFTPTARACSTLTLVLKNLSIRTTALHSRLTQRERLQSLSLFRSATIPVLVTTDVGARGLDIEDVAMVINWDVPLEPETYTHRVGRTARKGKVGVSVSFVGKETDGERVEIVEERIGTTLEEMTLPEEKMLEFLNKVSTAKRLANMELHDSDFGRREEIHKIKKRKREKDIKNSTPTTLNVLS